MIAAGNFSGKFTLGDQSVEPSGRGSSVWIARMSATGLLRWLRVAPGAGDDRFVRGLVVAGDGRIVVDIVSETAPRYTRVRVEPDGSKDSVETLDLGGEVRAVAMQTDGNVVSGPLGSQTCRESSFQLHRLDARGKVAWSACNEKDPEAESGGGEPHLEMDPNKGIAFCATYRGHAPVWGSSKAPAPVAGTHAFIASFTTSGKHRWTHYVTGAQSSECDELAISAGGEVAALVEGMTPKMVIASWKANGETGWTRPCDELLPGDSECTITALIAQENELVAAMQNGGRVGIARLDAKTGATKESHAFEHGTKILTLAANASTIVFGTLLHAAADFGTGSLTPTKPDGDGDVLIGAL